MIYFAKSAGKKMQVVLYNAERAWDTTGPVIAGLCCGPEFISCLHRRKALEVDFSFQFI